MLVAVWVQWCDLITKQSGDRKEKNSDLSKQTDLFVTFLKIWSCDSDPFAGIPPPHSNELIRNKSFWWYFERRWKMQVLRYYRILIKSSFNQPRVQWVFRQLLWSNAIFLPLLLLLPLYPELSELSLLTQLFPAMLYGSSSSGMGNRGRHLTFTGRCTKQSMKIQFN